MPPHLHPFSRHNLSLIADRCTTMPQLKQVHAQMIVSDRISDNFAASRIIAHAALADIPHALLLLRHTADPNTFMWNTLIRALADTPHPSEAIRLFITMQRLNSRPGKHTFPFVLKACANVNALHTSKQIHGMALKVGLYSDMYVSNGLLRCYSVCGVVGDARKVFDETPEKTVVVWTTMVSGYVQNLCNDDALRCFYEMKRVGVEPCDATLASVLSACARVGGLDLGKELHSYIKEKGIEVGVILGTALVDMYAKNGSISNALEQFRGMTERNTATWNAMICGLAHHGHADDALELFREMEKEAGVRPNDISFVGVLTACCHAGRADIGREIFYSSMKKYGITPKIEHYGCLVDLLGRCGRLEEAEELIRGMECKADVVVLVALLTACKNHGNIEIAERVVREVLKLEPNNHGVHVILSNMYAEAGRWDAAARIRSLMRDGGLSKIPGWSSVDGDGK